MSVKKEALGKGIRALLENIEHDNQIKEVTPAATSNISMLNLDSIEVNPFQPRMEFDEEKLRELSDSIALHGVIQPITVRKLNAKKYQLIAGERRLKASKMSGLVEVPAFVRTANDQEMLEMALIENTHREDLNALEVAINYKRLIDECNLKPEDLGERVGKDRTTVTNYLRLLKLPPEIQKAIREKSISMAHARAMINMQDPMVQLRLFTEIVKKDLSVRATEMLVKEYTASKSPARKNKNNIPHLPHAYKKVQDQLASHLGTRVILKQTGAAKGEITILFFSNDDLDRINELILQ